MPERSATDDMISGLNHITLAVRDIDRSFRFYVETLGARPLARWSRGVYLLVGELWLCLTMDEGARPAPPREYSHIAFSVPAAGFDAASARIRGSGAVIWQAKPERRPLALFSRPQRPQAGNPCWGLADPPRRDEAGSVGTRHRISLLDRAVP
jgi:catechol 2,3-dioxygenase-like lactoylglutathione lyase family enzyme